MSNVNEHCRGPQSLWNNKSITCKMGYGWEAVQLGRMFRTVWHAAPNANMYMHIMFAVMLSEEAKYNHGISSQ